MRQRSISTNLNAEYISGFTRIF